jgi:hypothetical protein
MTQACMGGISIWWVFFTEYVVQSIGFSGITAGIKKMDSFTPPSNCMNSPIVQTVSNRNHH